MADRSLRRTIHGSGKPTVILSEPIAGDDSGVSRDAGTEQNIDRSSDADDRNANLESNGTERIRVVEIAPERLSEFIEQRAADRDNGTGDGDGNGSERRTRKPRADAGQRRGKRGKSKEAPQNIEPLVTMVHTWASILFKTPELMLDAEESKGLSDAYAQFCEHHDVPIMTEKRMSEINLVIAVLSLYGPRFVAFKNRKKNESQRPNITQMPNRAVVNH